MQNTNIHRISVVIPCYNEEAAIGACLDALASQIPQPSEVIVVDNNCTDRTAEIAQSYGFVTVIQEKNGDDVNRPDAAGTGPQRG